MCMALWLIVEQLQTIMIKTFCIVIILVTLHIWSSLYVYRAYIVSANFQSDEQMYFRQIKFIAVSKVHGDFCGFRLLFFFNFSNSFPAIISSALLIGRSLRCLEEELWKSEQVNYYGCVKVKF